METMRYRETKKSIKGVVFCIVLFLALGVGIIYFAIKTEKEPIIVGQAGSDVQSLMNIDSNSANVISENILNMKYEITDKKISDKTNVKFKGDITLPVISMDGTALTELNQTIEKKYTEMFNSLKNSGSLDNKFTYIVSYSKYDNVIDNKRILSITLYERTLDDQTKKNTMSKITTYNIDFDTKQTLKQNDVIADSLGSDCKTKIKNQIKDYVIGKNMMKQENYQYTYTGLENFYIKDDKFHIIFNEGELVDKKYGVLDITIE